MCPVSAGCVALANTTGQWPVPHSIAGATAGCVALATGQWRRQHTSAGAINSNVVLLNRGIINAHPFPVDLQNSAIPS